MPTSKQGPSFVSNYQQIQEQASVCGRSCLGACCLPGAKLPVYTFTRLSSIKSLGLFSREERPFSWGSSAEHRNFQDSLLNTLILAEWEDRFNRGLFRYDVTACETKVLPGECGFIAQLNEGRHSKKRPTEFRVDQVLQPFDSTKFNFMKVGQEELLFCFEESADEGNHYSDMILTKESPNVVLINVSPIEHGHVLLVPRILDCMPQQLEAKTLLLALQFAREVSNPYFRLGYNSLGAFATINHLHFQAYYLETPFPVERARVKRLCSEDLKDGVKLFELANYPVRGIVYELGNDLEGLVDALIRACNLLEESNIPFNVLIADRGTRIFLFPQCYVERQARGEVDQEIINSQVNPAVWEISGHIVLKRREDYEMASEDYALKLLSQVSLSVDAFNELKDLIFGCQDGKVRISTLGKFKKLNASLAAKGPSKIGQQGLQNGAIIARNSLVNRLCI